MYTKIFLSITAILMITALAFGIPANPKIIMTKNINGEKVQVRQWGDEFAHGFETLDGFSIVKSRVDNIWYYAALDDDGKLVTSSYIVGKDDPVSCNIQKHLRISGDYLDHINKLKKQRRINTAGKKTEQSLRENNVLAIFIEYPDLPFTYNVDNFQQLLFSRNPEEPRSAADYYNEVSYGKYRMMGKAVGWYRAKNNCAYYGADDAYGSDNYDRVAELVQEAVEAADPDVDFSEYDNDKDGIVDSVNIFYSGTTDGVGGDNEGIWPHMYYIWASTNDGVTVMLYCIQPELWENEITTIGIFAHEYGHILGLPDLYDYDGSSSGVGIFDIMCYGSYGNAYGRNGDCPTHFSAWCKNQLSWLPFNEITLPGSQELSPIELNEECYMTKGMIESYYPEYFLIENRQKVGFDKSLPGEGGILIWHIDESAEGNDDEQKRLVDLEQAQDVQTFDSMEFYSDRGSDADYFKEGKSFTGNSNPDSKSNTGQPSGVCVVDFKKMNEGDKYSFYTTFRTQGGLEFLWKYQGDSGFYGDTKLGPDGTIYSTTYDNRLFAINPDGTLKWSFAAEMTFNEFTRFTIGTDGTIYIYGGIDDPKLFALNPDGTQIWTSPLSSLASLIHVDNNNGAIYVGTEDFQLYSIGTDGTINWQQDMGEDLVPSNIETGLDGTIYLAFVGYDTLYAMETDGSLKWKIEFPVKTHGGTVVAKDGTIYSAWNTYYYSNKSTVYHIYPDGSYEEFFKLEYNSTSYDLVYDNPIIDDDGTIYLLSYLSGVYAVDTEGKLKWNRPIQYTNSFVMGPDGNLYIRTYYGNLVSISKDGNIIWSYNFEGEEGYSNPLTEPAVSEDGTVYVGSYWGQYLVAMKSTEAIEFVFRSEASVDIFNPDNPIKLKLDIFTPGIDLTADIYFIMLDQTTLREEIFFAPAWDNTPQPLAKNITIPSNLTLYDVMVLEFTIPSQKPPIAAGGNYTFAIGAFDPVNFEPLSNVATVEVKTP
ncbi:M6 family metalloprotease domain-containing protein [bacterium]|nr:M6 family metalloprotease domain-containing protein [bacterium]